MSGYVIRVIRGRHVLTVDPGSGLTCTDPGDPGETGTLLVSSSSLMKGEDQGLGRIQNKVLIHPDHRITRIRYPDNHLDREHSPEADPAARDRWTLKDSHAREGALL